MLFQPVNPQTTYASRENALKALEKKMGERTDRIPYLISVNEEGRFFPVVIGAQHALAAHNGICVVG